MIIEDNRKDIYTLGDIKCGDAFAIKGSIYIKTNNTSGFDADGSYYRCVDLNYGTVSEFHEVMNVEPIKVKVVILDEDGCSNGSD